MIEEWNGPTPYPGCAQIARVELDGNSIKVYLPIHGRDLEIIRGKVEIIGREAGMRSNRQEQEGYHIHTITYRSM